MSAVKQALKEPEAPSQPGPPANMPAIRMPQSIEPAPYGTEARELAPLPVYSPRIAAALSDIMGEIGGVVKGGENKFHNYKYQRIEDILSKVTPLLAKHGITIVQSEVGRALFDNDGVVSVSYAFTIIHKSGDVWPDRPVQTGMSRARDSKGGFDDKSFNKCHTAARKCFLKSLFMITDTETPDNDGEENYTRKGPLQSAQKPIKDDLQDEVPDTETMIANSLVAKIGDVKTLAELDALSKHEDTIAAMSDLGPKERARVNAASIMRRKALKVDAEMAKVAP